MQITKIFINPRHGKKCKAVACVYMDSQYVINDIRIVLGEDGRLRVEFPKSANGRFAFSPVCSEGRSLIEESVINQYLEGTKCKEFL